MTKLFIRWFRRNFSNPQSVVLLLLLVAGFVLFFTLSKLLAPVIVAIVLAYLLDWIVQFVSSKGVNRLLGVYLVFGLFITSSILILFGVIPLIWQQTENLVLDVPNMFLKMKNSLMMLPEKYPSFISVEQVNEVMVAINTKLTDFGKDILSLSVSSLINLAAILVYVLLVPLMLFFFLKDKTQIVEWCKQWLPEERNLANRVWSEVNDQIGNYIRGKIFEILIVAIVTFIVFQVFGLRYSLLLALAVGFSVLIPYIGAAVVTIPVALIAYVQWGFEAQFIYVMIAYGIIQLLDGNLLVPFLFSEAVNLHPVAIIIAVLFFGGLWGFWGVFFAIPLATLVKAVISAWSEAKVQDSGLTEVESSI